MEDFIFGFLATFPWWVQLMIIISIALWMLSREQQLRMLEKYKHHDSYTSKKQREAYQGFIDIFFRMTQGSKIGKPIKDSEVEVFMLKFYQDILLYGSPEVIKAIGIFKKVSGQKEGTKNIILCMEQIIKAMRNEMGLSNIGIKKGELIQIIITDDINSLLK